MLCKLDISILKLCFDDLNNEIVALCLTNNVYKNKLDPLAYKSKITIFFKLIRKKKNIIPNPKPQFAHVSL